MSTNSASLRELYIDPAAAWSFLSTTQSQPVVQEPSYLWSRRAAPNSIFDLSPSLDPAIASRLDVFLLFKSLVASAVLHYSSSAIVMPWETAKLLLQVQWVPKDVGELDLRYEPALGHDDDDEIMSDTSNDDSYFTDPYNPSSTLAPTLRPTDQHGYVIRRSVLEEGTRPEYIIPVGSSAGVWGMIKRMARFRAEGWLALWKGLLTSCVIDVLSSSVQPVIDTHLQSIFFSSSLPLQPPIILTVASHLITGFLLSPLDLIRTRLIVQSFTPRYRSYSGPIDALARILRDEGGLKGIYLHPHLLLPTIIDNALRPFVSLALPRIIMSSIDMRFSEQLNTVVWAFVEFGASFLGLLITLPFETIRRRLQLQARGTAKPLKGCVELRPAPYNGIVDAAWHIMTEERSDLPIQRINRRRSTTDRKGKERENTPDIIEEDVNEGGWFRNTGIGQLYRGMGMRLSASAVVFVLTMFSGGDNEDGWAEL